MWVVRYLLLLPDRTIRISQIQMGLLSSIMHRYVGIYVLRVRYSNVSHERIGRCSIVRFRFARSKCAFMFPLQPFGVKFDVRGQRYVLYRER